MIDFLKAIFLPPLLIILKLAGRGFVLRPARAGAPGHGFFLPLTHPSLGRGCRSLFLALLGGKSLSNPLGYSRVEGRKLAGRGFEPLTFGL
jgi:hypothetical protein